MKYVLDSNVFIEASRTFYAFDIAPSFWETLVRLAAQKVIGSIDKVKKELEKGNDQLSEWIINNFNEYFTSTKDDKVLEEYKNIVNWAYNQNQYSQLAKKEFMKTDYADTWILAFAKKNGLIIVTQETYNSEIKKKIPIPNVCEEFNIEYCNLFKLLRDLKIKF